VDNAQSPEFVTSFFLLSHLTVLRVNAIVEMPNAASVMARLCSGDADAFDVVFNFYRPRVFSFFARLCRRRDLAEEFAQETFLRLAEAAPSLSSETRLGPWLFTVARNMLVSHWRHARWERDDRVGWEPDEPVEWISPFDLAMAGETQQNLEKALAALSPTLREAVLLVAVERFEQAEAAQMLSINSETLRQRLSRARTQLAQTMNGAKTSFEKKEDA
jgi:RNA polymerase sigma-70 factor (ECF subfamily)